MNATLKVKFNKVCVSIETMFNAGKDWKQAIEELKPLYNKATVDEQHEMRNAVATLVGKLYKVKPHTLEFGHYKGTLGFERDTDVSKFFRRCFPVDKKSTPSKGVSKQVDRVAQRATQLKKDFTKAEIRRLVALLSA